MSARPEITPAQQIAKLPPELRALVNAARRSVRDAAPKANEIACTGERPRSKSMMWKIVRYTLDDEPVVAIGVFTSHASMFFAHGGELDDPDGILEGAGKQLRYITLRTREDARHPRVKRVLRRAFAHARARNSP
jgi:hypothetical protein